MSIFSRKREKKEVPEAGQWYENPLLSSENEEKKAVGKNTNKQIPIAGLYDELQASKKGGLFKTNSDYYNAVSDNLVHVLSCLAHIMSKDIDESRGAYAIALGAYQKLIASCQIYLQRSSITSKGQARQGIVTKIMQQAQMDVKSLEEEASLGFTRRKKLTMNKTDAEYNHVGGAMSRLTVLEKGDLTDSDESGFFKEQDIFTYHDDDKEKLAVFEIMERAKEITKISDSLYEKACAYINEKYPDETEEALNTTAKATDISKSLDEMPEASSDEKFIQFVTLVKDKCKSWNTAKDKVNSEDELNMKLKEGEKVNLSNRNVATSRVAEVLGVGNLIAKSETVEMIEPGQQKGRVGNLMQKAEGNEAAKFENPATAKISGNFQKQLTNLQVLDYLTGQVDRHTENYMVQQDEEGNFTGLTGIDNDLSFGNAEINEISGGDILIVGGKGRSPVDKEGNFVLPHMDKAFANRILSLTKEQLTFLLVDLVEEKNIKFACERLETLKKAIAKAMREDEKKDKKVFLNDGEWNENTLQDSIETSTYMSVFLYGY